MKMMYALVAVIAMMSMVSAMDYQNILGSEIEVTVRTMEGGSEVVTHETHSLVYTMDDSMNYTIKDSVNGYPVAIVNFAPITEEVYQECMNTYGDKARTTMNVTAYKFVDEDGEEREAFVYINKGASFTFIPTPEYFISITDQGNLEESGAANHHEVMETLYDTLGTTDEYNMVSIMYGKTAHAIPA